ncbi:MAG: hypothetical protein ACLGI5_20880 [Thermoleophilia bacterium]
MDLVGAWLRQLLKAGTAAALVPAAMLAAVAVVLFGAGGFGGLGSLGQLLSGPQITPAERIASGDPAAGRDVAPVAPADAEASRRSAAAGRSQDRGGPVSRAPAPPRARPVVPAVDPGAPPRVRPPRVTPLPPPPPPAPPPAARPPPPTVKERTQVLVDKLKDTVGDVGTAVEEIVEGLGQTLGRIGDPLRQRAP